MSFHEALCKTLVVYLRQARVGAQPFSSTYNRGRSRTSNATPFGSRDEEDSPCLWSSLSSSKCPF